MRDEARRTILERRAAFMAAALVVAGPCDRVRDLFHGDDASQVEEQAPSATEPKACLASPHRPTKEELGKPDAGAAHPDTEPG